MNNPETATLADFARIAGLKPRHVTRLRLCGRLVLSEDGRRVRVADSLARIEATRDAANRGELPVAWPELATLAEFAAIANFKPSYITALKGEGRLVLADDGKRVRVAESLAMIKATRDPSKAGVAARHAAVREAGVGTTQQAADDAQPGAESDVEGIGLGDYQDARAMRERYLAKAAKRDYEVSIGKLLDADHVVAAVAAAATTLRTRFESLPDVLGPQLVAAGDEAAARAILADAIEHALEETSRAFAALARSERTA